MASKEHGPTVTRRRILQTVVVGVGALLFELIPGVANAQEPQPTRPVPAGPRMTVTPEASSVGGDNVEVIRNKIETAKQGDKLDLKNARIGHVAKGYIPGLGDYYYASIEVPGEKAGTFDRVAIVENAECIFEAVKLELGNSVVIKSNSDAPGVKVDAVWEVGKTFDELGVDVFVPNAVGVPGPAMLTLTRMNGTDCPKKSNVGGLVDRVENFLNGVLSPESKKKAKEAAARAARETGRTIAKVVDAAIEGVKDGGK